MPSAINPIATNPTATAKNTSPNMKLTDSTAMVTIKTPMRAQMLICGGPNGD
jgi:hypothetical protein